MSVDDGRPTVFLAILPYPLESCRTRSSWHDPAYLVLRQAQDADRGRCSPPPCGCWDRRDDCRRIERPSLHKKGPRCLACACRSGVQVCASKTGWKERPSNRMRQGGHRETQNPGDLNSATDSMIQMVSDAAQSRHYKKGHDANSLESGDILQHSQNSAAAMLLVVNAFRADPKPIYEASTAPISVVPGGIGAAAPCAAQN